jgi:hypothetical protein
MRQFLYLMLGAYALIAIVQILMTITICSRGVCRG